MKRIVLFLLLSVVAALAASGHAVQRNVGSSNVIDDNSSGLGLNLKVDQVSPQGLLKLLSGKNMGRIDDDGDLFVTNGTYKGYVFVKNDKKIVRIIAWWKGSLNEGEIAAIRFANEFNYGRVLGKATYTRNDNDEDVMNLEYEFVYNAGVNSVFFNETLNWFWSLCSTYAEMIKEKHLFE
jgi:hypothetical protein